MSEKTSQKTEEEMLDQTFGEYDEEITVDTSTATGDGSSKAVVKKKNNTNAIIIGVVGVLAVGVVGAKFLSSSNAPAQQEPVVAPQPVAEAPVVSPTPEPVAPVVGEPVAPTVPPEATVTPVVPEENNDVAAVEPVVPNTPTLPEVGQVPTPPVEQPAPVAETPVVPTPEPVAPVVKPEPAKVDVASNPNVLSGNAQQSDLVNQIQSMFDKQNQDFKGALSDINGKITNVEKVLNDQQKINLSVEERLSRLEAGKSVVYKEKTTTTTTNIVKKPKKKAPKKAPVKPVSNDVLIDKSANESSSIILETDKEKDVVKVEPKLQGIEIHSVYAGRIWTKNADGSLSTFVTGDRLPSGEVIKKVDDEKFQVTTDKRVIGK